MGGGEEALKLEAVIVDALVMKLLDEHYPKQHRFAIKIA